MAIGGPALRAGVVEVANNPSVSETVIPSARSAVWGTLGGILDQLEIEPTYQDLRVPAVGNPRFEPVRIEGQALSRYLDCGAGLTGEYADVHGVTMSLLIELGTAPGGGTSVKTTVDAYAQPRAVAAAPVHCRSRGNLERRIWELIGERVGA